MFSSQMISKLIYSQNIYIDFFIPNITFLILSENVKSMEYLSSVKVGETDRQTYFVETTHILLEINSNFRINY